VVDPTPGAQVQLELQVVLYTDPPGHNLPLPAHHPQGTSSCSEHPTQPHSDCRASHKFRQVSFACTMKGCHPQDAASCDFCTGGIAKAVFANSMQPVLTSAACSPWGCTGATNTGAQHPQAHCSTLAHRGSPHTCMSPSCCHLLPAQRPCMPVRCPAQPRCCCWGSMLGLLRPLTRPANNPQTVATVAQVQCLPHGTTARQSCSCSPWQEKSQLSQCLDQKRTAARGPCCFAGLRRDSCIHGYMTCSVRHMTS
jgi:hypothetical protein